jgi:hypothetical protein
VSRSILSKTILASVALTACAVIGAVAVAAPSPIPRPGLFFKEEWRQDAKGAEHPVSQQSVGDPNLELKLYGATAKSLQITGKAGDEANPIHLFSGECSTPCAVALRHKGSFADLTGLARIRINTKMSGFHKVWPIVKLADGAWYVADHPEGASTRDWIWSEFNTSDLKWTKLDIDRVVTTGPALASIDLSKVDEIGFADLMPASGHGPGGWFDLGQIEVYAKPTPR